jgi:hypothetical protein
MGVLVVFVQPGLKSRALLSRQITVARAGKPEGRLIPYSLCAACAFTIRRHGMS